MNKSVIFGILTVLCMVLIFCFSAQNSAASDKTSDSFTVKVLSTVSPKFKELNEKEKVKVVSDLTFPVRKSAHFSIYFILGIFSALTFLNLKKPKFTVRSLLAFALCALYSVSDEIHQYFVPGRSCELRDMLIDSSAALIAVILVTLYFKKKRRKACEKEKAS